MREGRDQSHHREERVVEMENKVIRVISDQLGIPEGNVKPSSVLVDDLGADDFDMVTVTMALEEEFDLSIPDGTLEGVKTVQGAIDYITKAKE